MSISYGRRCIASIITSVSSHTERFCGSMSPHDSAWMISARLLMLFEAGSAIVALIVWGAVIVYCMVLFVFLSMFRVRFFQCSEFVFPMFRVRFSICKVTKTIPNYRSKHWKQKLYCVIFLQRGFIWFIWFTAHPNNIFFHNGFIWLIGFSEHPSVAEVSCLRSTQQHIFNRNLLNTNLPNPFNPFNPR